MKRYFKAALGLGLGLATMSLGACGTNPGKDGGTTGGMDGGAGDMTCASYEAVKPVVMPDKPLYNNEDEVPMMDKPAKYECVGKFKDKDIADPGNPDVVVTMDNGKPTITLKGKIRDFQDDQPVWNADIKIFLSADDVLAPAAEKKWIASLKEQQLKADPNIDPKLLGTAMDGTYTITYTLPNVTTTRIIIHNIDGRALDNGTKFETIPTYEFFRLWNERNPVAIKLATKQAIPGLVSVTQRDGLGVLAGGIRDCEDNNVGGATVQVTGGNYPGDPMAASCADGKPYDGTKQNQIFYFAKVGGSTLPTRVRKWTSGNGAVAALNVPPGKGKITVKGILTAGGMLTELNSAEVPVIADAVTIVDLPPK